MYCLHKPSHTSLSIHCAQDKHTHRENVRFAWSSSSGCASVSDFFGSVRLSLQSFSQQLKLTLFRGNRQFELSCDLSVIFKSVATSKLKFSQIQIQTFCMSVQIFSITHINPLCLWQSLAMLLPPVAFIRSVKIYVYTESTTLKICTFSAMLPQFNSVCTKKSGQPKSGQLKKRRKAGKWHLCLQHLSHPRAGVSNTTSSHLSKAGIIHTSEATEDEAGMEQLTSDQRATSSLCEM